jgi:D-alanine transaminase
MTVFYNGNFIAKKDVKISPDDRGFLFGDGVYEVVRSYFGCLFMFNEHINRLNYSLKQLNINFKYSERLENIVRELIEINDFEKKDGVVYLQITRGCAPRSLKYPEGELEPTVYITLNEINPDYYSYKYGIKASLVDDIRWQRCDIKSVNLLANVIAHNQAVEKGSKIGLFVKNGIITEGTHVGLFGVKDNELITHPSDNQILPSITRGVIFNLCNKLNITITEQAIRPENVYNLDELFIVGTSPEIAPVIFLDNKKMGNGTPGTITVMLQQAFSKLIRDCQKIQ